MNRQEFKKIIGELGFERKNFDTYTYSERVLPKNDIQLDIWMKGDFTISIGGVRKVKDNYNTVTLDILVDKIQWMVTG